MMGMTKLNMKKTRKKTADYLPERSCVVCRRKDVKSAFLRLVNTEEGVTVDRAGTLPGRGAYVCGDPACLGALTVKKLNRALKCSVSAESLNNLPKEID